MNEIYVPSGGGGGVVYASRVLEKDVLVAPLASKTFTLPVSGYEDIELVITGTTSDAGSQDILGTFNSDGNAHYATNTLFANDTGAGGSYTGGSSNMSFGFLDATGSTTPGYGLMRIMAYLGTSYYKLVQGSSFIITGGNHYQEHKTHIWTSTAAITTLTVTPAAGNFEAGTRFVLYGLGAS